MRVSQTAHSSLKSSKGSRRVKVNNSQSELLIKLESEIRRRGRLEFLKKRSSGEVNWSSFPRLA